MDDKKYAIVTGCSSGLGYAITEYLLDHDYIVFGASRSGGKIIHDYFFDIECDVRVETSVESFFRQVKEVTPEVHLLVNNAGIFEHAPIDETLSKSYLNQFNTNAYGTFLMLKNFEELLVENQSHIISILSIASKFCFANSSAYCASKAAQMATVETIRKEWQKYHVRFSNLYPGAINTPMQQDSGLNIPINQMLRVDDVLHVFTMVLDSASYIDFSDITFAHKY